MKKRKLICALALVACCSVSFVGCNEDPTASEIINENFRWANEQAAYSQVKRYDGWINSGEYDREHNLAVIRSRTNGNSNSWTENVEVIDLKTEQIICSTGCNVGGENTNDSTVGVTLDYPLVQIAKYEEGEGETYYSYYLATGKSYNGANALPTYTKSGYTMNKKQSLYEITIGNTVYWVNEEMEVLRTFNKAQTQGYSTPSFDGAYGDYLYAWTWTETMREIQVYNKEGVCSMKYTYPSDVVSLGYVNEPMILNDGNIFVQEHTLAEETSIDYTYKMLANDPETGAPAMLKMDVTSKIIDYKTGEVKEVALDYIVCALESAYACQDGSMAFPFQVRWSAQNQAYIAKISNQELTALDYVTLDNEGNIGYTVENTYLKHASNALAASSGSYGWSSAYKAFDDAYVATVTQMGKSQMWLFNAAGEKIGVLPDNVNDVNEQYAITDNGIYDYDGNCVYDLTTCPFYASSEYEDVELVVTDEQIYFTMYNTVSHTYEIYAFDGVGFVAQKGNAEMTIRQNGVPKANAVKMTYVTGNEEKVERVGTYTWTLYKANGEALLRTQLTSPSAFKVCKDVGFLQTEIDGKEIVYVVK